MELLYIHIKSFRKIENQDINFGGKYRFEYDVRKKELTVSENQQHIENFYSGQSKHPNGANIVNVSSIIGANGVGKTTILDLIKNNFVSGKNGIYDELAFAIQNEKKTTFYHYNSILIEKHNCNDFGIQILELVPDDVHSKTGSGDLAVLTIPPRIDAFKNTDFVYFSSIFDDTRGEELSGSSNISTNFLIRNDYSFRAEMSIINHSQDKRQLENFKFSEISRQIAFIVGIGLEQKLIPFELPSVLTISLANDFCHQAFELDSRNKSSLKKQNQLENFNEIINYVTNNLSITAHEIDGYSHYCRRLLINAFLGIILDFLSIPISEIEKYQTEFSESVLKHCHAHIKSIRDIISKSLSSLQDIEISLPDDYEEKLENLLKLEKLLLNKKNLEVEYTYDNLVRSYKGLQFNISDNKIEEFRTFYSTYNCTYILRPYLNFEWRSISSGEKALLNMYSRFYALTNSQKFGGGLNKNLIILLDEPDVFLHPQWQKNLLKLILDFFTVVFAKTSDRITRNIQIIFTTNSPIPASDLLSSNTIFLKRENQNTIVKDSLTDQRQTFAANIHTLFSDSFFIENGLIGDFAAEKINTIIRQLNRLEKLSPNDREIMRKTIMQIGEPVIKNKLIQMYNDRFNMDIHERIDNIEKKLGEK